MAGFVWLGDVLVNSEYITHVEKSEFAPGQWQVQVNIQGVNADSTSFFSPDVVYGSEAEADAAMLAIAAGTL